MASTQCSRSDCNASSTCLRLNISSDRPQVFALPQVSSAHATSLALQADILQPCPTSHPPQNSTQLPLTLTALPSQSTSDGAGTVRGRCTWPLGGLGLTGAASGVLIPGLLPAGSLSSPLQA